MRGVLEGWDWGTALVLGIGLALAVDAGEWLLALVLLQALIAMARLLARPPVGPRVDRLHFCRHCAVQLSVSDRRRFSPN